MDARSCDIECYRVRTRVGIRIDNRLSKRASTAIVRVGNSVDGKQTAVAFLQVNAKGVERLDFAQLHFEGPVAAAT